MYGGGYGGPGYSSNLDSNPYLPGTQVNPYDADPTRPGVQIAGTSVNGVPHYSNAYDQNPYVSGTQVGGVTNDNPLGGVGYTGGVGGYTGTTTTTYTTQTGYGQQYY